MNENIFLIEDEEDISELISYNLSQNGFIVNVFSHGIEFLANLEKSKPDLVILDLMLPDIDGFEICRRLKNKK
jgi:DNA-binding response OmpR family regulator